MCGIFGIIHSEKKVINKDLFSKSAKLMHHRGPDAYGQWGIENKIELAHLRLAIVDLKKESNQPFFSTCNRYVIVFNGEIYNYIELRAELIELGYIFRTESDTEVLLNAFIEWGEDCVNKFNGDWAFAIYDIQDDKLFCSRDRFGVKPFNYAVFDEGIVFSSEIKSIIDYYSSFRIPNYNVISNYCRNSLGAQSEDTWFLGVKRLLPAHNLIFQGGKLKIYKFWTYPLNIGIEISMSDAQRRYLELFKKAVELRLRTDVPFGVTLSSGIDSTSIAATMKQLQQEHINTYTAVFDNKDYSPTEKAVYSKAIEIKEHELVKKFCDEVNFNSNLIHIDNENSINDLAKIIWHLESGHSSPAVIPLSRILKKASDDVTVVLEGQGADELIGGYILNVFPWTIIQLVLSLKFKQAFREFKCFTKNYSIYYSIKQFFRLLNLEFIEKIYAAISGRNRVYIGPLKSFKRIKDFPLLNKQFSQVFNRKLFESHTGGLVNLLHYGDAISMSHSLESRLPFLDYRLVEFCFQLPFDYKVKDGLGKYIHRKSMVNIVPDYILGNPIKYGFNTPLSKMFSSLTTESSLVLLSDKCAERGLFCPKEIKRMILKTSTGENDYSTQLFRLLSVELWFQVYFD